MKCSSSRLFVACLALATLATTGCLLRDTPGSAKQPPRIAPNAEARRDATIDQLTAVLELLEAGAHAAARREIQRLGELHPTSEEVALLQELLTRREIQRNGLDELAAPAEPPTTSVPVDTRLDTARTLIAESRLEEAYQVLEDVHRWDPENSEVAHELAATVKDLGIALYAEGSVVEAVECWERALQLVPDDPQALKFIRRAKRIQDEQP